MPSKYREQLDLTGKVAIVTGASRGIGAAIAEALAEFGAHVVVSSRKLEAVSGVAESIRAHGGKAEAIAAHVGDVQAVRNLVQETCARCGGVDIVVNNAATNPVFGPILETDEGVFAKIMQVNVLGPLELCKAAHPVLKARGGGSIINISSVGGLRPEPGLGLYSVSKAALINLTKVLAQEWAKDGIRANVICPGLVQTKFSAALWQNEEHLQRFLRTVPLGRIAQPEEMALLAVYLAAPASAYCTGAVFTIDGGLLL
ncbi:MAG: glucose 1-dehydrogenase [Gemmatales bacterium]|nr:glucose 1-dehydrogenase [Gemmatales bacterium]MDW8388067.1 glucose 1-dehydrogenase [Gemmatales bacterium]